MKSNSIIYYKDSRGYYHSGLYLTTKYVVIGYIVVLVLSYFLNKVSKIPLLSDMLVVIKQTTDFIITYLGLCLLAIVIFFVIYFVSNSVKYKGFKAFLTVKMAQKQVSTALLNTNLLNRQIDRPTVAVPIVSVFPQEKHSLFTIAISQLPNMSDLQKLSELVSSALTGRLSDYAVSESYNEENKQQFIFVLENVMDTKMIIVTKENLNRKPLTVELQKDIFIELEKQPHMAITGKSGSGKSTLIRYFVSQLFSQHEYVDLKIIDSKDEFQAFQFLSKGSIVGSVEDTLQMMNSLVSEMHRRQQLIASKIQTTKKMGMTASECGLKVIVCVIEEIGGTVAEMDSKQRKEFYNLLSALIMKGRSNGIILWLATQFNDVTVIPNSIRSQCATKILLGTASQELQRMSFGQTVTQESATVPVRQGYYVIDGMNNPKKFWVADIKTNEVDDINYYESLVTSK